MSQNEDRSGDAVPEEGDFVPGLWVLGLMLHLFPPPFDHVPDPVQTRRDDA